MYTPEDLKSEDAKKYDWTQVYSFSLPAGSHYARVVESIDDPESMSNFWDLDDRLIDVDMLVADPVEADRIYLELKERAIRRKRLDAKEKRLSQVMNEDQEEYELEDELEPDFDVDRDSSSSESQRKSEKANKILNILEKSTTTEKLDFTNGLINFVEKLEQRNIDALLPALKLLAND